MAIEERIKKLNVEIYEYYYRLINLLDKSY